jgi:hypothetical protein
MIHPTSRWVFRESMDGWISSRNVYDQGLECKTWNVMIFRGEIFGLTQGGEKWRTLMTISGRGLRSKA